MGSWTKRRLDYTLGSDVFDAMRDDDARHVEATRGTLERALVQGSSAGLAGRGIEIHLVARDG